MTETARLAAQALLEDLRSRGIDVGVDWIPAGSCALENSPAAFLHVRRQDGAEATLSGFDVHRLCGLEAALIDVIVEEALRLGKPDCPHLEQHRKHGLGGKQSCGYAP